MVPQVYDPRPLGLSLMAAMVFTFEPDHVKAILATQFDCFEKGPVFRSQLTTLLGTGVFNSDGEMWKFHRSITRPFFSKERISHFEVFDRHSEDTLNRARMRQDEGYPVDFQDLVARFTLDSASEFLFGNCVRSLSARLPYPPLSPFYPTPPPSSECQHPSSRFVDAFLEGQLLSALRTRYGPFWALLEFWKDRVSPLRAIIDEFAQPVLEEAIKKNHARKEQNVSEKEGEETLSGTLLDHLVSQTEDHQILKDELVNLLVASRDTVRVNEFFYRAHHSTKIQTASTLTFAMYMLTQHPDIVTRLRAEISRFVGMDSPTYEHVKEMKYMRAFINGQSIVLDLRAQTMPTPIIPKRPSGCTRQCKIIDFVNVLPMAYDMKLSP
ncbi:hypothetical protein C0992_012434 [Termitomyces sp. T32_za158]|nr:hypothetical protein C0992_012434 [Termitomyces sp. T32_za158]